MQGESTGSPPMDQHNICNRMNHVARARSYPGVINADHEMIYDAFVLVNWSHVMWLSEKQIMERHQC